MEADRAAEKSVFRFYQSLLRLRRSHDAFLDGAFRLVSEKSDPYMIYTRSLGDETWAVICNFEEEQEIALPFACEEPALSSLGRASAEGRYAPYECAVARVK